MASQHQLWEPIQKGCSVWCTAGDKWPAYPFSENYPSAHNVLVVLGPSSTLDKDKGGESPTVEIYSRKVVTRDLPGLGSSLRVQGGGIMLLSLDLCVLTQ